MGTVFVHGVESHSHGGDDRDSATAPNYDNNNTQTLTVIQHCTHLSLLDPPDDTQMIQITSVMIMMMDVLGVRIHHSRRHSSAK